MKSYTKYELINCRFTNDLQTRRFNTISNLRSNSNSNSNSKYHLNTTNLEFKASFSRIKYILDNNPLNSDTQMKLETLLVDNRIQFSKNKDDSFIDFPNDLKEVLFNLTDVFYDGYIEIISGNKRMVIKNDKIIKIEQNISLKPIPKPKNDL